MNHIIFSLLLAGIPAGVMADQSGNIEMLVAFDIVNCSFPIPFEPGRTDKKECAIQEAQSTLIQETNVSITAILANGAPIIHTVSFVLPISPSCNQFTQGIYLRYLSRDPPTS